MKLEPLLEIKSPAEYQPRIFSEIALCLKDFPTSFWQERKDEFGKYKPTIIFNTLSDNEYQIYYRDRMVFEIDCETKTFKAGVTQGVSNIAGWMAARNLVDSQHYTQNVDDLVIKDMLIALDLPFTDVFPENVGKYIERFYNIFLILGDKAKDRTEKWHQYLQVKHPNRWQQKDLHGRIASELSK